MLRWLFWQPEIMWPRIHPLIYQAECSKVKACRMGNYPAVLHIPCVEGRESWPALGQGNLCLEHEWPSNQIFRILALTKQKSSMSTHAPSLFKKVHNCLMLLEWGTTWYNSIGSCRRCSRAMSIHSPGVPKGSALSFSTGLTHHTH